MDPFNGDIVSMVGGVNYDISNFNRVTQAYRQPGSSIKPFIYAQALETRYKDADTFEGLLEKYL